MVVDVLWRGFILCLLGVVQFGRGVCGREILGEKYSGDSCLRNIGIGASGLC